MVIRIDIADPNKRTKEFFETLQNEEGAGFWDGAIHKYVKFISAEKTGKTTSRATFSLVIDPSLCNRMNNLHGGCAATILDVLTSVAIAPISRPGFWQYGGVSRSINCTYLRPAPVGTKCTVVCEVVHAGKRMAQIRGEILGPKGEILCYCEHGKASIDPEPAKL